jgi:beta-fructofuranosidase
LLKGALQVTIGQKVIPETLAAYATSSVVSNPSDVTLSTNSTDAVYVAFDVQPTTREYAISATLRFDSDARAGFRVLSSNQEWTDVWFDSEAESLVVDRTSSSLISTCT